MYRFEYKAYRRALAGAFSNARDQFSRREGLLVRMEDRDGRVGFGEAAPIAAFGSESFPSALSAAAGLAERLQLETALEDLRTYPALRWAVESAVEMIAHEGVWPTLEAPWPVCGLMPDLEDMGAIEERLSMHYRCLKFKIGKRPMLEERRALDRIVDLSGGSVALRLDANGSLDLRETTAWLDSVAELPVEFLEQPMKKGSEREMIRLSQDFPIKIALDESVSSVDDLKRWRDAQWPGIYVIKPSLSGGLAALREELENGPCDCVFSSALETKIGAANAIGFALRNSDQRRALGFGVERLFADGNVGLDIGPFLQSGTLPSSDDLQSLWNRI